MQIKIPINAMMVVMAVAFVAPAVTILVLYIAARERERTETVLRAGSELAGEIAYRLGSEFQSAKTILTIFGSSGWLEAGEYERLHARAQRALRGTGRHLIVVDEQRDQLLNTRVPFDTTLGKSADLKTLPRVLETGVPAVSDLFRGGVADAAVYNMVARVALPNDEYRGLILTRNADDLAHALGRGQSSDGWNVAVLDGEGQVAYPSPRLKGSQTEATNCAGLAGSTTGAADEQLYAIERSVTSSSWRVCAWAERPMVIAGTSLSLTLLLSWSGMVIVAALAVGYLINRSVASMASVAKAIDVGVPPPELSSPIQEIDGVMASLRRTAEAKLVRDQEMGIVLRETAHRAKNQLAISISLLRLSAHGAPSVAHLKEDLTRRLTALGRSVDMLTSRSIDAAPFDELVRTQLTPFVTNESQLRLDGEQFLISQSAAQSFGLIFHELATNCAKYGAWTTPGGLVTLRWATGAQGFVVDWTERGGPPPSVPSDAGFGTSLIDFLVKRAFAGAIERRFVEEGFVARIVVPVDIVSTVHSVADVGTEP